MTLRPIRRVEGGNYLTWRKSATQLIELNEPLSASVGIGQIKPATAKLAALQVYRDWETVSDEDLVVHTDLIYDTDYSLKFAAGYIKLMEMSGIDGDYNLFMCYAISVDAAKAWKPTGYSLNTNVLTSVGLIPSVMQQRAKFYAEAVSAIS
jgi:hypothetical protein